MKFPLCRSAVVAALALSSFASAQPTRVVEFGGDMVTSNQFLRGITPPAIAADLDGDGVANDSYTTYPFNGTPLNPTSANYTGMRFYGGIRGERLGTSIAFSDRTISNNTTADTLNVRYQAGTPTVGRFWALVYFDKADLRGGGADQPVKFDWKSRLALDTTRWESLGQGRWVVREGGQFYVSRAVVSGSGALTFTNNTNDGEWAPYSPTATDLNFDQENAVWTTQNFQNITGVGFLVNKNVFSGARHWLTVRGFTVDAYVGAGEGTPNLTPQAAFSTTLTPSSGKSPVTAAFDASATTDADGDTLSYAWDFGDGTTGTGVTVNHVYATPGFYRVALTVTDSFGNGTAPVTQTLTIRPPNAPPVANATASPTRADAPVSVTFNGTGSFDPDGAITTYSWNFGDGEVGSGPTPTHLYVTPGRHIASLTVSDEDGATATTALTIDATVNGTLPPIAAISIDLASGYAPLTSTLSGAGSSDIDGTVVGYHWDFGDGATATGVTATHTWATEGSYSVTLTVTDDQGATAQARTPIRVGPALFDVVQEGHVRLPGSFMVRQLTGEFTVTSGGVGLRADSGQYFYLYQALAGDGEFTVRVAGFGADDHPWASAGVMMMAEPIYGAPFVAGVITKEKGAFAYGKASMEASKSTIAAAASAPHYVKVARTGTLFTASISADGETWSLLSSFHAEWPTTIAVGIVAAAGQNGGASTAAIDDVRLPRDCGSPSGGPMDNPVASLYGAEAYPWTDDLKWECVYNINDFAGATDDDRYFAALQAAMEGGGGVIYFPAGTYTFSDDLYLTDGIVIRGEAPVQRDATSSDFAPPTKFVFPKYEPTFTGSGTGNDTAFKRIYTLAPDTDSNIGVVYVDINRGGITFEGNANLGTNQNIVVLGVRQNNVAEPDGNIPGTNAFQHGWQRWSYRFTDNIGVQAFANVLVANNRLNDNPSDNYAQPGYVIEDTSKAAGSPERFVALEGSRAVFSYTDHYGIAVNRSKSGGYVNAATPETEPSLFRKGIVIRDNWVFSTMRVKIHASGDGMVIANNVMRDEFGKTRWVDATGRRLVGNSATLENRGIDWSGYNVVVSGNDVEVHRHRLKDTIYLSVDGEGILIQECCGGTLVKGVSITDNIVNAYIGIYKMRDIHDAYVARNVFTAGPTADGGFAVYVVADTNNAPFGIFNSVVEDNVLSNGSSPASITFRGNNGAGTGNVIRDNRNENGNGVITYSAETNATVTGNIGFPVITVD